MVVKEAMVVTEVMEAMVVTAKARKEQLPKQYLVAKEKPAK